MTAPLDYGLRLHVERQSLGSRVAFESQHALQTAVFGVGVAWRRLHETPLAGLTEEVPFDVFRRPRLRSFVYIDDASGVMTSERSCTKTIRLDSGHADVQAEVLGQNHVHVGRLAHLDLRMVHVTAAAHSTKGRAAVETEVLDETVGDAGEHGRVLTAPPGLAEMAGLEKAPTLDKGFYSSQPSRVI